MIGSVTTKLGKPDGPDFVFILEDDGVWRFDDSSGAGDDLAAEMIAANLNALFDPHDVTDSPAALFPFGRSSVWAAAKHLSGTAWFAHELEPIPKGAVS